MEQSMSDTYHFIGEYEHSVDQKNRLILPSSIRDSFENNETLILSKAPVEPCLTLFPFSRWEEFLMSEELNNGRTEDARKIRRRLTRNANKIEVDSQGRILLPDKLKDIAGIKDTVTVVGNYDRVELWSPEVLSDYQETDTDEELQEIEEKIFA